MAAGYRSPPPEAGEVQLDRIERFGAGLRVALAGGQFRPAPSRQAIDFQGLNAGITQPEVSDTLATVDPALGPAVHRLCAVGNDLACPVGRDTDRCLLGLFGETFATPACQV